MGGVNDPREVLTRPATAPDVTVRYGPLPEHVADVRWPLPGSRTPDAGPAALVLVVHGGFWRAQTDRQHTGPQCVGLAGEGFAVAAIEYRRSGQPGGGWPGTLEDVAAAADTVPGLVAEAAAAAGVGVDAGRTVLLGHSAGGHLVAWLAARSRPDVVGAVSLGGVLDLDAAYRLRLDPGLGGTAVEALLGGGPDAVPDRYAAADPARLGPPAVPVQAVHGTADDIVPADLSRSYAAATGAELVLLDGVEHFAVIDPLSPAWPDAMAAVRRAAREEPR
jgi:acetyl esterase/lipase